MNRKDAYHRKLDAQLEEWKADIDKLEAKAGQWRGEAMIRYQRNVEQLRAQQEVARDRLENLKNASDDAWEDLKSGVETAWRNLGESIQSASSRFG